MLLPSFPLVRPMASSSQSARVVFWRNLIARRRSSRLTVRELCERAGVSPASFFHWQQRLRAADSAQASVAPATVLPVRIVEDRLAEITVELPLGVRVPLGRDCDEATLQHQSCVRRWPPAGRRRRVEPADARPRVRGDRPHRHA